MTGQTTAWAIRCRSETRLNGKVENFLGRHCGPDAPVVPNSVAGNHTLLFETRENAREFNRKRHAYLRGRPDLRAEPHGVLMPQVVMVQIEIEEVPAWSRVRLCSDCLIFPPDGPSGLCPGCEAYRVHLS